MSSFHGLPLLSHLLDLLYAIRDDEITLTLAGGLGIYLKRLEVVRQIESIGLQTLRPSFPEARATSDIDLFLRMEIFADHAKEARLRRALCADLHYVPKSNFWQFEKLIVAGSGGETPIKIDLMARSPMPEEKFARAKDFRVGTTGKRPASEAIHGRGTPEAFAIDVLPSVLRVEGRCSDGIPYAANIFLPHPFASVMMKLKASHDHAYASPESRKPDGHKHAFDVYLLLAMMTESEWTQACDLAKSTCANEPMLQFLKSEWSALFATDTAPGCLDIMSTVHNSGERGEIDLSWLRMLLGELMAG